MKFQRAHTANPEMDAEGQSGAPSQGPGAIPASSPELNAGQDDFRLYMSRVKGPSFRNSCRK